MVEWKLQDSRTRCCADSLPFSNRQRGCLSAGVKECASFITAISYYQAPLGDKFATKFKLFTSMILLLLERCLSQKSCGKSAAVGAQEKVSCPN
jgi:hypothetical protein